ncbi:MAG: TIGR01212 family radical SAM protein [Eubacterium sp.]|nr:TIGR01212 family radical SAM protein [Eubacterium sp.]
MDRYLTYSSFLKEQFGGKVYKICLNGGFTCPNRDGSLSTLGCLFCSEGGSGDFGEDPSLSVSDQIIAGKKQTSDKYHGNRYIAYFQAFTNTYGPVEKLNRLYREALASDEVVGLAIATRPDCLPHEVLELLRDLNQIKPVFIELGLQTCHDETARRMNRGYETKVFTDAASRCGALGLRVTAHVILGLPGEDTAMMYETISYLNSLPVKGIKLSMLHILKNSPLAQIYEKEPFHVFTLEEYVDLVISCIERLRPDMVIERITGDGPKRLLIAPSWSGNKRLVLNTIHQEMRRRDSWQGKELSTSVGVPRF